MALSLATVGAKITATFINLIIPQVNAQGYTAVIPTSVAGTGVTLGAAGKVSFSASTSVSVNGCFTSTYDNYLLMWEALTLLDLRNGDRIGHGTAMGIRPSLWLDRMPDTIILPRGEWMLGVLAAWQLLRDGPGMQACACRLQRELEEVAEQIFGRSLAASDVEHAMALRGLNRCDLMRQQTGEEDSRHKSLNELWRQEAELVRATCQNQPQPIGLLWGWLSDAGVQARSDELIAKDAQFLDAPTYVRLQQALMQHVAERGVLIETMPSSNVRISQYYNIDEHHWNIS